jgi:MOSC domain-containing protein YiiM
MGQVVSIVYAPRTKAGRPQGRYARVPLEVARLVENRGIEGDAKGRPGRRQLNVMAVEVVAGLRAEGFRTAPGELGEQVVIGGIPADELVPGARLRLGQAVIEVTLPRTGCDRFEAIQGKPRAAAEGRLGVLARVLTGGEVRVGDEVTVVPPGPSTAEG